MSRVARHRAAFHTLGCKVNQSDTAAFQKRLQAHGFEIVPFEASADVYIINSCVVTTTAAQKSRQTVRKIRRREPEALIILAGCYPEMRPSLPTSQRSIFDALPFDAIIGIRDRDRLVEQVLEMVKPPPAPGDPLPSESVLPPSSRPIVKAQEGCDEFCHYCVVPYVRGPMRSRAPAAILDDVEALVGQGHREIVLAGTHLGAYERSVGGEGSLSALVARLAEIDGDWRLRLSSIEPMDLDRSLLLVMAKAPRVVEHLHLPLQSGSDRILKAMGRRYTTAELQDIVVFARRLMPNIGVTTDVLVGFPGEQESDHEATLALIEKLGFSRVHVFPFSPRPKTMAKRMPDPVASDVKRRRRDEMLGKAQELAERFHRQQQGELLEVLVEQKHPIEKVPFPLPKTRGVCYYGYSRNYVPVWIASEAELSLGQTVCVRIRSSNSQGCFVQLKST